MVVRMFNSRMLWCQVPSKAVQSNHPQIASARRLGKGPLQFVVRQWRNIRACGQESIKIFLATGGGFTKKVVARGHHRIFFSDCAGCKLLDRIPVASGKFFDTKSERIWNFDCERAHDDLRMEVCLLIGLRPSAIRRAWGCRTSDTLAGHHTYRKTGPAHKFFSFRCRVPRASKWRPFWRRQDFGR